MKQPRKIAQIFMFLTTVLLVACSGDDNDSPDPTQAYPQLIIGSWTWTSQSVNGVDVGPLSECELMETFIYDGTQVEQIDYSGTPCVEAFTSTENYEIEGDIITFSSIEDPADSYSDQIIELNATTLKIKYTEEYDSETYTIIDTYTRVD